jgi:hypothetical protein
VQNPGSFEQTSDVAFMTTTFGVAPVQPSTWTLTIADGELARTASSPQARAKHLGWWVLAVQFAAFAAGTRVPM